MDTVSSKNLKSIMIERGLGVVELAKLANLTNATVSSLLKNNALCRLPTISRLAKALNVSADVLILKE